MIKSRLIDFALAKIGGTLDGKKRIIGGVCLLLYVVVSVSGKMFPDLHLPGMDLTSDELQNIVETALGLLGVSIGGAGLYHGGFKDALPIPPEHDPRTAASDDPMKDLGS